MMLGEMTSLEVTEWQAYFILKDQRRKDEERDAKMKSQAERKKGGFKK